MFSRIHFRIFLLTNHVSSEKSTRRLGSCKRKFPCRTLFSSPCTSPVQHFVQFNSAGLICHCQVWLTHTDTVRWGNSHSAETPGGDFCCLGSWTKSKLGQKAQGWQELLSEVLLGRRGWIPTCSAGCHSGKGGRAPTAPALCILREHRPILHHPGETLDSPGKRSSLGFLCSSHSEMNDAQHSLDDWLANFSTETLTPSSCDSRWLYSSSHHWKSQ